MKTVVALLFGAVLALLTIAVMLEMRIGELERKLDVLVISTVRK